MSSTRGWKGWASALAVPALLYVTSRLVVLLAVAVDMALRPGTGLVDDLIRWDGTWYLAIAERGYPAEVDKGQNATAFFPLYPLAIRALAEASPLGLVSSALVIAGLGGLAATLLLWGLVERLSDRAVADRAAALFAFFPSSYVFSLAYSEGLMLPLAIGSLWAATVRRWVLAGGLAALATAARPNAVALVLALGWGAVIAVRRRRELRALVGLALAPLGIVAFAAYLSVHTGDPLVSWRAQQAGWGQGVDFGATTAEAVVMTFRDAADNLNRVGVVFALVVALAGAWCLWRWRPPALLSVYAAGVIVPVLLAATISSRPRFVLTAFPLVAAIAWCVRGGPFIALIGASTGLLATATAITVSGLWLTP